MTDRCVMARTLHGTGAGNGNGNDNEEMGIQHWVQCDLLCNRFTTP